MASKRSSTCLRRSAILVLVLSLVLAAAPVQAQRPTLYWGTRGNDVKTVQWRLLQWDYFNGKVDGIYGAETAAAVRKFQRKNGLKVDGVVGSGTWAALGYRGTAPARRAPAAAPARGGAAKHSRDLTVLAQAIRSEAEGEPYVGQVSVGAVILNRVEASGFPNTIAGVIFQPGAFESVSNGTFYRPPLTENVRAARDALNGWDPTHGALFFWNPSKEITSKWIWTRKIHMKIGGHVFAR